MIASHTNNYIAALVAVLFPYFVLSTPISFGGGSVNQLRLIGTVDGKTYFAEGNMAVTWLEAKAICKSSGLHLATVTSVAQATLLKEAYNNATFYTCHWTGGRDSLKPSQFSWDFDDEALNSAVVNPFTTQTQQTCICFNPSNYLFYGRSCERKFEILCELRYGNVSK